MQRKRERTHDSRPHAKQSQTARWKGKREINVNENTIQGSLQHTHTHTHRDAHIPLGLSKERKCESCQPIGD